ncbi:MAG TPA: hypothetical protein VIG33_17455 [Pseudobdellovibrionaceae bacterium]|jgi:hypothetical protein
MKTFILPLAVFISHGIFSGALPAHAESFRCEGIFAQPVVPKMGYIKNGLCSDNIFYFFRKLKAVHPDEDFSNTQVLYLYPRWTGAYRYNMRTIKFKSGYKLWMFHVVLLHKGLIYEYDHESDNDALPVAQFFEESFGSSWKIQGGHKNYIETVEKTFHNDYDDPTPSADSQLRMHVRALPAEVYLNEYSFERDHDMNPQVKNYAHWVYGDPRFPDETLEDFLKKF